MLVKIKILDNQHAMKSTKYLLPQSLVVRVFEKKYTKHYQLMSVIYVQHNKI